MKKSFMKLYYLILVLTISIMFVSCEKKNEITSPDPVVNSTVKLSDADLSLQAKNVVNMVLNNSIIAQAGYLSIIPENTTANTLNKSSYKDDGYYILNKTFCDPDWPSASTVSMYVKIQFRGPDGQIIRDPRKSSSVYVYLNNSGAFGFINNEPYGDKTRHIMEGIWSNVQTLPTFNGAGSYERCWTGLYNKESTEAPQMLSLHYCAKIDVQELKLLYKDNTITASGQIVVTMDDYKAIAVADGSIVYVTVYKGNETVGAHKIDLSERIEQLVYYLNMLGI